MEAQRRQDAPEPKRKSKSTSKSNDLPPLSADDPFAALETDRRQDSPIPKPIPITTPIPKSKKISQKTASAKSLGKPKRKAKLLDGMAQPHKDLIFETLEGLSTASNVVRSTGRDVDEDLDEVADEVADELANKTQKQRKPSPKKRLQHRQVEIDALGQPSDAIILENPDRLRRRSESLEEPSEDQARVDLDLGLLKPRNAPESEESELDEVMKNIDELNLRGTGTMSEKEIMKHRDTLVKAFTMKQLQDYLALHASRGIPSPAPGSEEKKYSSIRQFVTEWRADTPDISLKMTKKNQLAYRVITHAWGVKMYRPSDLGFMRLSLFGRLRALLTQPTTGALDYAKEILDESAGETMSLDPESRTVDIRCRNGSVHDVLQQFEKLQSALRSAQPPMSPSLLENVSRTEFRNEIARITGTVIAVTSKRVAVLWLDFHELEAEEAGAEKEDKPEPALPLESKGDVAMRLLRGKQYRPEISSATVAQLDKEVSMDECIHVPYLGDKRSLSLSDKMRAWTRWTAPSIKPRSDPVQIDQGPISSNVDMQVTKWRPLNKAAHSQHFAATFGYILHDAPEPLNGSQEASGANRILAPFAPHPAAFNEMLKEDNVRRSAFMLLRFTPVQKEGVSPSDQALPTVYLKLPVTPESDFSKFAMHGDTKLYADSPRLVSDVLLPENPVDVRVNMFDRLWLPLAEQPALVKFFEASKFNLAEGRLQTPSSVKFLLPPQWPLKSFADWKAEAYDFAGLEVHQVLSLKWQTQFLRYSSIEGGQQGGRRQQLTLEHKCKGAGTLESQRDEFLKAADTVTMGRAFPWVNGHKLVIEEEVLEDAEAEADTMEQIEGGQDQVTLERIDQLLTNDPEELSDVLASVLENSQHLAVSAEDAVRSYAAGAVTDDTVAAPGEELFLSITTEECEEAISETDQLMGTVEDALDSFMDQEAAGNIPQEVSEPVEAGPVDPHVAAIRECEAVLEKGTQLIMSFVYDPSLPSPTAVPDLATVDDQIAEADVRTAESTQEAQGTPAEDVLDAPVQPVEPEITSELEAISNPTAGEDYKAEAELHTTEPTQEVMKSDRPTSEDVLDAPAQPVEPEMTSGSEAKPDSEEAERSTQPAGEKNSTPEPVVAEEAPPSPTVQKPVKADESSPWGMAQNLFR